MRTKVTSALGSIVNAMLGKTRKPDRLDTATRMLMDAPEASGRPSTEGRRPPRPPIRRGAAPEPRPAVDQLAELERILRERADDRLQ
jgi:hypothetical protein